MPFGKEHKINLPNVADKQYISYLKDVFEPYFDKAFGNWEQIESTMKFSDRILINGKAIKTYVKDADRHSDTFYAAMAEAVLSGARVTVLPQNPDTGLTNVEPEVLSFEGLDNVRGFLQENTKETKLTSDVNKNKLSVEEIEKLENTQKSKLNSMENIIASPVYKDIVESNYNKNKLAQAIGISIYGEDSKPEPKRGQALAYTTTKIKDESPFRFTRSGVTLGIAYLLAVNNMTWEEIMDPTVRVEEKRAAGNALKELAQKGVEGRREMALIAAKASEILYNMKRPVMSAKVNDYINNYSDHFAATIFFDLNQEMNASVLKLQEAYEDLYTREANLKEATPEIKQRAQEQFELVNKYSSVSEKAKKTIDVLSNPISVNTVDAWAINYMAYVTYLQKNNKEMYKPKDFDLSKLDINNPEPSVANKYIDYFRDMSSAVGIPANKLLDKTGALKNSGVDVYEKFTQDAVLSFKDKLEALDKEVEANDPSYIRSSKEFRNMKAALKDTLKQYNATKEVGTFESYVLLKAKLDKLAEYSNAYLHLKEDINMDKASNLAKNRLKLVKGIDSVVGKFNAAFDKCVGAKRDAVLAEYKKGYETKKANIEHFTNVQRELGYLEKREPRTDGRNPEFLEKCINVKNSINDYSIPNGLNIEKGESALLAMIAVGTVKVSEEMENTIGKDIDTRVYSTVSSLTEDIFNERELFYAEKGKGNATKSEKMVFLEKGRKAIKECMLSYSIGDKKPLAELLGEGLKRFTSTFAEFDTTMVDKMTEKQICTFKVASEMFDLLEKNPELRDMMMDKSMGKNRLTKETWETYRAAKVTYNLLTNALEAEKVLLETDFSSPKTKEDQMKIRVALADLALKDMITQEIRLNGRKQLDMKNKYVLDKYDILESQLDPEADDYQDKMDELDEERLEDFNSLAVRRRMGDNQRKLTDKAYKEMRAKLANSKTIGKIADDLTPEKLAVIMHNEGKFFKDVLNHIKVNEASVLKSKGVDINKSIDKDNPVNGKAMAMFS